MEDIADEVEVGKGTIYRYFRDKEELYLALLKRSSRQFMERLVEEKSKGENPRAQLEFIVAAIIAFFDEHPQLFDLIQRAEVLRNPKRAFPWGKTRDELIHLMLDLFTSGRVHGEFTIREPELMALMLLGGLRSVIRFGERPRPRNLAKRIVEAFLLGADIAGHAYVSNAAKTALMAEVSPL